MIGRHRLGTGAAWRGLVATLVLAGCGGSPKPQQSAPATASAGLADRFVPSLTSRWWEQAAPCPHGAALHRDAAPEKLPDRCDQPLCELYCARADGTRHGPVTGWYQGAGAKHHEGSYGEGQRQGLWVVWYLGGEESDRGVYRAGEKDGVWKQWWEGGEPYRLAEFRRGKVVSITPYRDGRPLPTEYVEIEGSGVAPASLPGEPATPEPPPPSFAVEPNPAAALAAVRAVFPEAYGELATVSYLSGERDFAIDDVMVLIPEARITAIPEAELAARACAVKKRLGLDCACETVDLGPAKDYAWHSWPDKRVVPTTIHFMIGC